jgi:hypothetical protein
MAHWTIGFNVMPCVGALFKASTRLSTRQGAQTASGASSVRCSATGYITSAAMRWRQVFYVQCAFGTASTGYLVTVSCTDLASYLITYLHWVVILIRKGNYPSCKFYEYYFLLRRTFCSVLAALVAS